MASSLTKIEKFCFDKVVAFIAFMRQTQVEVDYVIVCARVNH
ncbi:hypothetical protein [Staphylococcus aureus]|nr:hypothetical protein [Staphylococcus aureus]